MRHVAQYSPLISSAIKQQIAQSGPQPSIKDRFPREQLPLSELPQFIEGPQKSLKLDVPVYTVWGACEDVQVLEKLRSGEYKVENLHIIDEAHSRLLDVAGVKLRLLGLGGAVVMHKLFDNGEGRTTIAGGQGTMWTTLLQMGELIDTANRNYDPTETRVFITHASPAREGLLNQLSVSLKADFSISAGLHFRYGSSYNEFSVNPTLDHYRGKLAASKASFDDVWQTVKNEVEPAIADNDSQQRLLNHALDLVSKMPTVANGGNPFGGQVGAPGSGQVDESAFKNMWNFNLADAAYGWLILDIENGRIGTEMRAQGFNFSHRSGKINPPAQTAPTAAPAVPAQNAVTPPVPQNRASPAAQQQPPRGPAQPNAQPQPPNNRNGQQQRPAPPNQQASTGKDIPKAPQANTPAATTSATAPAAAVAAEKLIAADSKTNGVSTPAERTPQGERKLSPALFVRNTKDEDETRNIIAEEDREKIDRIQTSGRFFIVWFNSPEEAKAALDHLPADLKGRSQDQTKPNVSLYREDINRNFQGGRGGAAPGTGYRSGGERASDSEGGRGGFRGGRGGRGRGERGDRGGRGGGRGRGFNKGEGDAPSAPATSA